jgi:large subunit ribosomal protein L23
MKTIWDVIKAPLVTEKAVNTKERSAISGRQVLSFRVAGAASKHEIRDAVEKIFKVKVEQVRVAHYHGKQARRGRFVGKKPDWKKAYVTLATGSQVVDYGDVI